MYDIVYAVVDDLRLVNGRDDADLAALELVLQPLDVPRLSGDRLGLLVDEWGRGRDEPGVRLHGVKEGVAESLLGVL